MNDITCELVRSPHVGDEIRLCRDALVEVASPRPGAPPTWRYLAAGSRGRLIGWRERPASPAEAIESASTTESWSRCDARAVMDVAGNDQRLVVFVRESSVSPAS